MQTSLAKKIFAVGASGAMLLAAMPFVASADSAHAAGTNVLSNNTIYFINAAGQKQPYTSAGAFTSYGFNSWSNVVAATAADMALPTGSFVTPADGSVINDNGTIYVITNGQRAGIANPTAFLGLGYAWNQAVKGDTSFMTTMAPISSAAQAHLPGTLINKNNTVFLVGANGILGIPTPAVFNSWGYSWNKVVLANSYDNNLTAVSQVMPTMALGYLNPLAQLAAGVTTPTTPSTGSGQVSVSLASTNPAAGSVAKGAKVTLAAFNLTAGSAGATINTLVANRIGLSSDSDVTNLYLYNDATNSVLGYGTFNQGVVTFNGSPLLMLGANQSAVVSVRADMNTSASVGDTIGYSLASVNAFPGLTVSGNFPVSGNLFQVAALSNLGALNITSTGNVSSSINPGTTQTTVGYFQLSGSNQPLSVSYIKFTAIGSTASTDLQNFTLWNGATQVGSSTQMASDKTVTFNLAGSPLVLASGTTANLYVKADVVGGSSRTFQLTIQRQSDVVATDTTYNTGIVVTLANSTAPIPSGSTNQFTIAAGNSTVQVDSASAVGNVPLNGNHVTLATFDFTSTGEPVRIQSIPVNVYDTATGVTADGSATNSFTNAQLVDVTNSSAPIQIGSNMNLGYTTGGSGHYFQTTFNIPGYWVLPTGTTKKLAIIADTKTLTSSSLSGHSFVFGLGTISAQGLNSLQNVTLTSGVSGRVVTLTSGALTAALNTSLVANSASYVPSQPNARIASFTLTAGSAENVNITQLTLTTGGAAASFQNLKVMIGGTQVGQSYGSLSNATAYTFSPSSIITIPAGTSIPVDVYADISGNASAGTPATVNLTGVTATGAIDNNSVTATLADGTTALTTTPVTGQTVTIAAHGDLTVATDSQAPTAAQLQQMVMGSAQQTIGVYSLAATTAEDINVTKVTVTDTTSNPGDFQNFKLYVAGTAVPNATVYSESASNTIVFDLSNSPLVVKAGQTVDLYLKADVTAYPNAVSGASHNFNLTSGAVVARGAMSATATTSSAVVAGVNASVYKTALTVSVDATSPTGVKSPSANSTVAVMDFANASNSANQSLTLWPVVGSGTSVSFTINSNLPVTASTTRTFAVYKSTDLTTPVLKAVLTPTITSGTPSWNGTLTFNDLASPTATFTPSGTFTATATSVVVTPVVISAGQTQQLTAQFDTTDATSSTTNYSFTLSLQTQGSNKVWNDGVSNVSTINGLPLTFPTIQP